MLGRKLGLAGPSRHSCVPSEANLGGDPDLAPWPAVSEPSEKLVPGIFIFQLNDSECWVSFFVGSTASSAGKRCCSLRAAARRQRRALLLVWGQRLCQALPVPCARP